MTDLASPKSAVIVGLICPDAAQPGPRAQRLADDGADAILVSSPTQLQAASDTVDPSVPVFADLPAQWAEVAKAVSANTEQRGSTAATTASVALAEGVAVLITEDVASVRRVRDMFDHLRPSRPEDSA